MLSFAWILPLVMTHSVHWLSCVLLQKDVLEMVSDRAHLVYATLLKATVEEV
jgi:hypothetical protein